MLKPGVTLYFVRHGETDWNAEGRLQGQKDIPLNDVGRVQAEEVGRKLTDFARRPEDCAYIASPMTRTRETMEILRAAMGLHPPYYKTDERLRELTFGAWEGFTWREVVAREPHGAKKRSANKWHFVPPDGESYAMLWDRVAPAIAAVERDTVMVSHGGVARVLIAHLGGISIDEAAEMNIWQGRVLVFDDEGWRWV